MCLGIAHVSGKAPLSGQGASQIHNVSAPFALQIPWGEKGQIHCVSARPLVPREGLHKIHGQSLNTHWGKHRSGGAQHKALGLYFHSAAGNRCRFGENLSPRAPTIENMIRWRMTLESWWHLLKWCLTLSEFMVAKQGGWIMIHRIHQANLASVNNMQSWRVTPVSAAFAAMMTILSDHLP